MPVSGALAGGLALALGMSLGANALLAFHVLENGTVDHDHGRDESGGPTLAHWGSDAHPSSA